MCNINHVSVVLLTYSDRRLFLFKVIRLLKRNRFQKIILVLNGVTWLSETNREDVFDGIDIVCLEKNFGPAIGYSEGIKRALEIGAKLIWLLDDDNCPHEDAIDILLNKFNSYSNSCEYLALSSVRPIYQDTPSAFERYRLVPLRSCFMGFHILHCVDKIRNYFVLRSIVSNRTENDLRIVTAPYGGLLFHADLVNKIGYPRNDFIIYADDTEWTYRIIKNGGQILLITDAIIDDLDCSWDSQSRYLFYIWLEGMSDMKAYYRMRNCVYFFKNKYCDNVFVYNLNKFIYLGVLFLKSLFMKKTRRFQLLYKAILDGERGILGVCNNFRL